MNDTWCGKCGHSLTFTNVFSLDEKKLKLDPNLSQVYNGRVYSCKYKGIDLAQCGCVFHHPHFDNKKEKK